ncbi:hypothetical protein BH11ACT2_BH11ACT2_20140 [soil metagenome]
MRKPAVALAAVVAVALSALAPVTSADAASPTITGTLTQGGVTVTSGTVGWFDPGTGRYEADTVQSNGSYLITPPSTPYLLFAGLERTSSGWEASDPTRVGRFYGASSASDYLYQGLAEYPGLTASSVVDLQVDSPGAITGALAALARRYVTLLDLGGNSIRSVRANAHGGFAFSNLIPGRYELQTDATATSAAWTSPAIAVAAGATVVAPMTLATAGKLTGRVTAKGKPVARVVVSASTPATFGGQVLTDTHGRYSITGLGAGRYSVSVGGALMSAPESGGELGDTGAPGAVAATTTATVRGGHSTTKNIHVTRGAAVTTKLKLTPGAGFFSVSLFTATGRLVVGDNGSAGVKNAVTFFGLKPGRYSLYATDAKNTHYATRSFRVASGKTRDLGTTRFTHRTVTLTGNVAGAAGRACVYSHGATRCVTVHSGAFVARGIIPGSFVVTVQGARLADSTTKVTVKKSATRSFAAGAALVPVTGSFSAGGYPIARASGRFSHGEQEQFWTFSDSTTFTGSTFPGAASVVLDSVTSPFVATAPFWLTLPSSASKLTAAGGAASLGSVALVVNR